MNKIVIAADPREALDIELVGVEYKIKPPKAATSMALMSSIGGDVKNDPEKALEVIEKWVKVTFGSKTGPKVLARLKDPEDDLDINHLGDLMTKVTEVVTGNPTM